MNKLEDNFTAVDEIMEASLTHIKRLMNNGVRYSETVSELASWAKEMNFYPPEKRSEFANYMVRLIDSLEEWGEIAVDIGNDIQKLGMNQKEFCETILKEIREE